MYVVTIVNDGIETEIHGSEEKLASGNVVKGINSIDTFSFSLFPSNVGFDLLHEFKTLVKVYNANKNRYEFFGRVLYSNPSMEASGLIKKSVTCESYFGFLCDSQQAYMEEQNWTVTGLLQHIINAHNAQIEEYKRFTIGEVTVTDPNDNLYLGIQRANTWDTLKEKLVDKLGGEFRFRVVGSDLYIDYLKEIGETRSTAIALSRNMKSIAKEKDPSAYITRLIPLGSKLTETRTSVDEYGNEVTETVETEERLDITSVNNGLNYIDDEQAIEQYGLHVGYKEWDDVTVPTVLFNKGVSWLAENNKVHIKYVVSALDLSLLGLDLDDFDVYNKHPLKNALLGIDDIARIVKKNINVCEDQKSTVEFGENLKTLTDIQLEQSKNIESAKNNLVSLVTSVKKDLTTKIEGIDGVYFYVRYSEHADGHDMTEIPTSNTKYMGTCSTNAKAAPTSYEAYTWTQCRGEDGTNGTPGTDGTDGESRYFHVKYSDDGKTFTSNLGETLGDWMGTCVTDDEADPTNFDAYNWMKIVGEDGKDGIDGADGQDGQDGKSCYFFVKFSANANGYPMTEKPTSDTKYMGTCSTDVNSAPTSYTAYTWTQCRGENGTNGTNGTPGAPGADGRSQYLHIKYSDDGKTFTANNGETLGAWIGTLVDFNEADSANFADYTWKKFTEDVDEELQDLRKTIVEQYTDVLSSCEEIILVALESYTETSNFDEFKQTVEAQLNVLANDILMKFTTTTEQIVNVDGDLQSKYAQIIKYLSFNDNGITISSGDSIITLQLDNEKGIVFRRNGVVFGEWDGNNFYTGNIVIRLNERAQFGNFAFVPRSDGSLSFLKVGD